MKHNYLRSLAILALAALLIFSAFSAGCKLTDDEPENNSSPQGSADPGDTASPDSTHDIKTDDPDATAEPIPTQWPENESFNALSIVMRSGDTELTLYDFSQAFYSNQYFQYLMYGMIDSAQYCDIVVQDLSTLIYIYNDAKANGVELTQEELDDVDALIDDHIEGIIDNYVEQLEEPTDDEEFNRITAKELLISDLQQDGLDLESFIELAKKNVLMNNIAEKHYHSIMDSVRVSDDEVRKYVDDMLETATEGTVSDFVADMNAYYEGSAPCPVYIIDDCFSVNHIYMGFETDVAEDGTGSYLTDSRKDDEAELEARLAQTADYAAFMELEKEFGEDPGMDEDSPYREYGYIIHADLVDDYFAGFVYAAMNLHEGEWHAPIDPDSAEEPAADPELTFFTLQDGTKVVKVYTESGVHYIIVNKEYKRGPVEYQVGDEVWESWRDEASQDAVAELFSTLSEEWAEKYPIDVDMYTIRSEFAPDSLE